MPLAVGIINPKFLSSLQVWASMRVVAIDPANRTRMVCSQIGVFSLLGRAIRVLVSRCRIIVIGGIRGLTSLVYRFVVSTISAPVMVLLALVALVVLVLLRVLLSVNLPLDSRWILRLRRCNNLRVLLIVLWSGL